MAKDRSEELARLVEIAKQNAKPIFRKEYPVAAPGLLGTLFMLDVKIEYRQTTGTLVIEIPVQERRALPWKPGDPIDLALMDKFLIVNENAFLRSKEIFEVLGYAPGETPPRHKIRHITELLKRMGAIRVKMAGQWGWTVMRKFGKPTRRHVIPQDPTPKNQYADVEAEESLYEGNDGEEEETDGA